jgi:hypothetical protein
MKSTAKLAKTPKNNQLESKIYHLIQLNDQIKADQIKKHRLERMLRKSYFRTHDEYKNEEGVRLVTYKPQIQTVFKETNFKKDHPTLYEQYRYNQKVKIFRVR